MAGDPPLDPKTVAALGIALGDDLHRQGLAAKPVLIGMDTRESGPAIAAQLAEAWQEPASACEFAGVVTTPGVAYLTRTGEFSAGVMISASHNPFQDNGIKVFARTGYKLPDAEEHEIEEEIFRILDGRGMRSPASSANPLAQTCDVRPYLDFLLSTLGTQLDGLRIVIDCGNGAASALAPRAFPRSRRGGDGDLQPAERTKYQPRLRRAACRSGCARRFSKRAPTRALHSTAMPTGRC